MDKGVGLASREGQAEEDGYQVEEDDSLEDEDDDLVDHDQPGWDDLPEEDDD